MNIPPAETIALQNDADQQAAIQYVRPRQYQWEIFEQAKQENVIAYLDTGSGKTLISILLIKDRHDQLKEMGVQKQLFFLAPKVGLVKQQANVLREHTELEVGDYCGDMRVDWWTMARWRAIFKEKDAIVCTPAILLSLLRRSFIKMSEIDLIVFDECHHCKKGDPYNCIMQEWYFDAACNERDRPHILGLTASPLDTKSVARVDHVKQFLLELERNLDARIITVRNQEEVRDAAPLPESRTEYYSPIKANKMTASSNPTLQTLEILRKIHKLLRHEREAREGELKEATHSWMAEDSRWLDHDLSTSETAVFEQTVGRIIHAFEEVGGYAALVTFAEMLQPSRRNIYSEIGKSSKEQQETLAQLRATDLDMTPENIDDDAWWQGAGGVHTQESSRKVELNQKEEKSLCHILAFLYNQFGEYMDSMGQHGLPRVTDVEAMDMLWIGLRKHLRTELSHFEKTIDRGRLISEIMAKGPQADPKALVTPKAAKMVQVLAKYKLQSDTLAKFKRGDYNVMVSTSVAEEGLDNCHCSLIVRFTLPKTACQFIQSRGRARARGSEMVLMCETADASQSKIIRDLTQFEAVMLLEAQARARLPNPARDFVEDVTEEDVLGLPRHDAEYRVDSTGARVSISSAKSLLFQYCSKLPSDCYTGDLRPKFSTETKGPMFETVAYLPNSAHAKKAVGLPKRTRALAISAACLKAIELLHKAGGFNDYLIPVSSDLEPEEDEFHLGPIGALRESAATRLCYIRPKWPELLKRSASNTEGSTSSFLYRIIIEKKSTPLKGQASDFWRQRLGVVVPQRLLELPEVTPYLDDQKRIKVKLRFEFVSELELKPEQVQMMKRFHDFLQHRHPTVSDLCSRRPPGAVEERLAKDRAKRKRQRFQELPPESGKMSDAVAEEWSKRGSYAQTHFYEDALLTAKQYAERHGAMPRDPMEETVAGAQGEDYDPGAEGLAKRKALMESGAYKLYVKDESTVEEFGQEFRFMTRNERKKLDWRQRFDEEAFVDENSESDTNQVAHKHTNGTAVANGNGHAVNGDTSNTKDPAEEDRLIEEGTGFASAGAVAVPLSVGAEGDWELDWPAIKFAYEPPTSIHNLSDSELKDCLVAPTYIQMSFQKIVRRRHDLTPLSNMGEMSQSPNAKDETYANRMRRKYQVAGLDPNQKLIEVGPMVTRTTTKEMCFIPELCVLHPLKLPAYQLALYVPRILWWLHALLQGAELQAKLAEASTSYPTPPVLAITESLMSKSCDNNFNYERLEIIGDAFLKFEASLHCFRAFPTSHEGQLHNVKIKLVCNKHLAKIALELLELDKYIIVPPASFRWDVGHALPLAKVKRKVVADVLEALLGAYFMHCGMEGTADFMRNIMLLPEETRHPQPGMQNGETTPSTGMATKLENLLKYTFQDRSNLREACTHASWKEEECPAYERLEFLGDAIIDVFVVKSLAEKYKDISPGMVSDIREAAVNNTRLACVAAAHRCHHALRHSSTALLRDIGSFVKIFDQTLRQNTDADVLRSVQSGDKKADNKALGKTYDELTDQAYGLKLASAPKVMADLVESLVGAVYIDAGCQLEPAFKVLDDFMDPLPKPETVPLHPVRVLVEKAFRRGFIMKFNIRKGQDHTYQVDAYICLYLLASAEGYASRKSGKIMAARKALERWSEEVDYSTMPGQAFDEHKNKIADAFAKAVRAARPDLLTAGPGRINLTYEDHAVKPRVKIASIDIETVD